MRVFPIAWYATPDMGEVMHSIGLALLDAGPRVARQLLIRHGGPDGDSYVSEVRSGHELSGLGLISRIRLESDTPELDAFCFCHQQPFVAGTEVVWGIEVPGDDLDDDFQLFEYVSGLAGFSSLAVMVPPMYVLVEIGTGKWTPGEQLLASMKSVWEGVAWLPRETLERFTPFQGERFGESRRVEASSGLWLEWAPEDWDELGEVAEWLAPQLNREWNELGRGSTGA